MISGFIKCIFKPEIRTFFFLEILWLNEKSLVVYTYMCDVYLVASNVVCVTCCNLFGSQQYSYLFRSCKP